MRLAVEAWAPEYGASTTGELLATGSAVDVGVEVDEAAWAPLVVTGVAPAGRVRFVDGVRRVDARVWIDAEDGLPSPGVAASYAAGVVRCEGQHSEVETCAVRHGLFSAAAELTALVTRSGTYAPRMATGETAEDLVAAVQQRMRDLEAELAAGLGDADLLVVDGPLRQHGLGPRGVGYVKTHQTAYLSPALARVVGALRAGERTPLFLTTTSWTRYSWYVRLPAPQTHAWSGIIRAEVSGELDPGEARRLAELVTATLPRYASTPEKDPRAPQNLHPIAELERRLRHRLGDPTVLHRALVLAAARLGDPVAA